VEQKEEKKKEKKNNTPHWQSPRIEEMKNVLNNSQSGRINVI